MYNGRNDQFQFKYESIQNFKKSPKIENRQKSPKIAKIGDFFVNLSNKIKIYQKW